MNADIQTEEYLQKCLIQTWHRIVGLRMNNLLETMSRGEFFLLCRIEVGSEQPGCIRVSELAKHARVTVPAVSRMLGGLEKKGWIVRETDRDDRRNILVRMTEEGKKELEKGKQNMADFLGRTLHTMGEHNARQMIALCNQMADIMEMELTTKKETENA